MKRISSVRAASAWRWPLMASAIAIVVLFVGGVLVLRLSAAASAETRASFGWATHTLQVESGLRETLARLEQAESMQRGYLLSGDSVFIRSLGPVTDSATRLLGRLRELTRDNPGQQHRLDTLGGLMSRRFARLQVGLELARAGRRDSVRQFIRNGGGRIVMDSIHGTINRAIAAEEVLLERRQRAVDAALARRRLAESLFMAIAALALVVAGGVWFFLRRAERIVTICAWSKAIKYNGEWMSIETYMQRCFGINMTHGISPAEAARLEYENPGQRVGT